jgi:sporulation protein YlmC with PRC-barrel domain
MRKRLTPEFVNPIFGRKNVIRTQTMNTLKSSTAIALAFGLGFGVASFAPASATAGSTSITAGSESQQPAASPKAAAETGGAATGATTQAPAVKSGSTTRMSTEKPSAPSSQTGAAAKGGSTTQMSTDKPSAPSSQTGVAGGIPGGIEANELVGRNVVNRNGESVGEVKALVIQPEKNEIHAVISVGGFLGMGEHDVAIPLKELEVGKDNVTLMSQQSIDDLKSLPEYDEKVWRGYNADSPKTPQSKSQ